MKHWNDRILQMKFGKLIKTLDTISDSGCFDCIFPTLSVCPLSH